MNTRSKTTWGLALAAATLSLTTACGTELEPAPAKLPAPQQSQTAEPRSCSWQGPDTPARYCPRPTNEPTSRTTARRDLGAPGRY